MIDFPTDRFAHLTPIGSRGRIRLTPEEAETLRRQLGVAIQEATNDKLPFTALDGPPEGWDGTRPLQ
jgi:hypothetical protein